MEGKLEHILVRKELVVDDGTDELAPNFIPSAEHLSLINKYTLEPVQIDQVRAFPMLAMNDSIDRDFEQFTTDCVNKLAANKGETGPLGKSFILSHVSKELGNGRIYYAEPFTRGSTTHLKLWVYVPNTAQYRDFIENLVYGVYWAVSVGVMVAKASCSVCGVAWPRNYSYECENNHQRGMKYEGKLCYRAIELVEELYELSSVYLGAQYGAEVVKKMATESGRSLQVIRKAVEEVNGNIPTPGITLDTVPDDDVDEKSVVTFKSFPLAPESESWSFSGADGNALLGEDGDDWAKFKSAHTWFDPDNAETKNGYKLPHHKIIGGSIKTVWRGVAAAASRLMQAGTQVPETDVPGCKAHLGKHYKEFNKTPPWESEKVATLVEEGATLESTGNGLLVITKGRKVWEYDGTRVIRKEVRRMGEEIEDLTKELDTRTEELESMEADRDQLKKEVDRVSEENETLTKKLATAEAELESKSSVVEHYLEGIRASITKWYKLSKGAGSDKEIDTSTVERLLDKCGDDVELLQSLEEDYKEEAAQKFPDLVRRSTVEEPEEFEEEVEEPEVSSDDGVANELHG